MGKEFDQDLISGYLDGELNRRQRADVESELGECAQYRQVLDALDAMHEEMRSLPRFRLNDQFDERVMRGVASVRAEQVAAQATAAPVAVVDARVKERRPPVQRPRAPATGISAVIESASRPPVRATASRKAKTSARLARRRQRLLIGAVAGVAALVVLAVVLAPLLQPREEPSKWRLAAPEEGIKTNNRQTPPTPHHGDPENPRALAAPLPNIPPPPPSPPQHDAPQAGTLPNAPTQGDDHDEASSQDRTTGQRVIVRLDRNEDGTISQAEARQDRLIGQFFADIDANADGNLTAEEIGGFLAKNARVAQ